MVYVSTSVDMQIEPSKPLAEVEKVCAQIFRRTGIRGLKRRFLNLALYEHICKSVYISENNTAIQLQLLKPKTMVLFLSLFFHTPHLDHSGSEGAATITPGLCITKK